MQTRVALRARARRRRRGGRGRASCAPGRRSRSSASGCSCGVADAADRADGPEELVEAVLDLLVPALGDVATVDVVLGGERRRVGARVAPRGRSGGARRDGAPARARAARRAAARGRSPTTWRGWCEPDERADRGRRRARRRTRRCCAGCGCATALIVPLRARGRVIGALTARYGPSGRRHSRADLRFAEVLAGRVALALDNAGLTSELTVAEEQFGVVVHTLAEAVTDERRRRAGLVYANEAAVELLQAAERRGAARGRAGRGHGPLRRLRRGRPRRSRSRTCRACGCSRGEPRRRAAARAQRRARDRRGALAAAQGLGAARRRTARSCAIVNVIENVTEVKRAERAQRLLARGQRGARLLAGPRRERAAACSSARRSAARLLAAVGAPSRRCPSRARGARAAPADLRRARSRRRSPRCARRAELRPITATCRCGARRAARSLRRTLHARGRGARSRPGALRRSTSRAARRGDRAAGRRGGARTRAATTRRTAIARALQHGLLPPELPDVPGWSAAVLYRPAGEFNEVGGDFYDVFARPGGLDAGDRRRRRPGRRGGHAAPRSRASPCARPAELTGDVARAVARLNDTLRGQPGLPLCTVVCAALRGARRRHARS